MVVAAAAAVSKQVPVPYATLSVVLLLAGQVAAKSVVELMKITLPVVPDKFTAVGAIKLGVGNAAPVAPATVV